MHAPRRRAQRVWGAPRPCADEYRHLTKHSLIPQLHILRYPISLSDSNPFLLISISLSYSTLSDWSLCPVPPTLLGGRTGVVGLFRGGSEARIQASELLVCWGQLLSACWRQLEGAGGCFCAIVFVCLYYCKRTVGVRRYLFDHLDQIVVVHTHATDDLHGDSG